MSKRLRKLACAAVLAVTSGCAVPAPVRVDQVVCQTPSSHVEVRDRGTIVAVLGVRESRSGAHEGFLIAIGSHVYRVEDNADITGTIPLRRAAHVELQGQYECDDNVIHWTHHDPSGRHPSGYIEIDGTYYQ